MLLLDERPHVKIAVNSTYRLFPRRVKPYYEADSFPRFARMTFSKKENGCFCFENGLAYKSRRFEEPLSKQQYEERSLKSPS